MGQRHQRYSSDYNGYRPNKGVAAQYAFLAPATGKSAYEPAPNDWKNFRTLSELRAATGNEAHGVEVDFDIFERMTPPDPSKRHAAYHAMDLNFALKPNSKAVIRRDYPDGNYGFAGRAPDLGAIEIRQARAQVRTTLVGLATLLPLAQRFLVLGSGFYVRGEPGASEVLVKKPQKTLPADDEVGQLPEHVGVDLPRIGQDAGSGLAR